jgi:Bacterial CdiA-CT RNAse A domain
MRTFSPGLRFAPTALLLSLVLACNSAKPSQPQGKSSSRAARTNTSGRDLSVDESHGGHTLRKHVSRTDIDLRERLRREHEISAASTYTDRHTAETFIGTCLDEDQVRIQQWLAQERHPNLALDCVGDPAWPIGRSLRRGQSQPEPCSNATLVLKWIQPQDYFVLTSYPDCR